MPLLLLLALAAQAATAGLGRDPRWLALLHYEKGRSEADGKGFFLSPRGAVDPEAELEAVLRAEGEDACRFPARRAFVGLPPASCPRYETWREALAVDEVSLVFADAFLNNPASMFGHTFLRLRKKPAGPLDYTVGFAGNPDTDNALFYALKGLTGAFPGTFTTVPYYLKAQEYGAVEGRDLWEYPLDLTPEQVERLVAHLWELGSTHFDYYFFSENCSYQLVALLRAAGVEAPRFGFPTIPADTVRALRRRPAAYRPSHVSEMLARRALLTPAEIEMAEKGEASGPRQALALDAAYDYRRFKTGFQDAPSPEERALLVRRSKLGPAPVPAPRRAPLEEGHDTARVWLGLGTGARGPYVEAAYRAALHDLAADDAGYARGSQLEMGELVVRWQKEPILERAALVDIVSLSPWDRWIRRPSWRVAFALEHAKEVDGYVFGLDPGAGLAYETGPLLGWAMAETDAGAGPGLDQGWRLGAGGSAGLRLSVRPWWRLLARASYTAYWRGSPPKERLSLVSSWTLARALEARLSLRRRVPDSEAGAALLLYF